MQPLDFEDVLEQIVSKDPRYHPEAYLFVREALDFTQKVISEANKDRVRHITGQELLSGIRDYGIAQFGPMAADLFDEWGVHCCEDFGEIVFNMVENSLFAKTETDTREHFKGAYDFDEAFRKPFLPAAKQIVARKSPQDA